MASGNITGFTLPDTESELDRVTIDESKVKPENIDYHKIEKEVAEIQSLTDKIKANMRFVEEDVEKTKSKIEAARQEVQKVKQELEGLKGVIPPMGSS